MQLKVWTQRAGIGYKGARIRLCFVNPIKASAINVPIWPIVYFIQTGAQIVSEITGRHQNAAALAPRVPVLPFGARPYGVMLF